MGKRRNGQPYGIGEYDKQEEFKTTSVDISSDAGHGHGKRPPDSHQNNATWENPTNEVVERLRY
jgi:hypothetical protein